MAKRSALETAFDAALAETRKSIKAGLTTASGESARAHLEELEKQLTRERQRAVEGGRVDQEWVRTTVRAVVEWLPETELKLIAALGAIARASPTAIT